MRAIRTIAALLCALLLPLCACAEGGITLNATLGYDGMVTYMRYMPLQADIENRGADIDGTLAVRLMRTATTYDECRMPLRLASGASTRVTLPLYLTMKQAEYQLTLTSSDGRVLQSASLSPLRTLSPRTLLVGVMSKTPETLSYMNINSANDPLLRQEVWQTLSLSADTFPHTRSLLDTFSILVFDDADLTALSEAQLSALDEWLRAGGVMILGGGAQAADNLAAFSRYAGVTCGLPETGEDVSVPLMEALEISGRAIGSPCVSVPLSGDASAVVGDARGALLTLNIVDGGAVFTCAFSLSDKPFAQWAGGLALWQRLLLHAASSRYQQMANSLGSNSDSQYFNRYYLDSVKVPNRDGVAPVYVLMALFLLLSGFGGYFLLKRFDRREWLWAYVPVCSALFAVLLAVCVNETSLREPLAVSLTTAYRTSAGTTSQNTFVGFSGARPSGYDISADGADLTPISNNLNYNDNDVSLGKLTLDNVYTYGESMSVRLKQNAAWDTTYLRLSGDGALTGGVDAQAWWESDGLHAQITNNTGLSMESGALMTASGYCTVPALAPGESAQCAILYRDEDNGSVRDGYMPSGGVVANDYQIYTVMSAYRDAAGSGKGALMTAEEAYESALRDIMINACQDQWQNDNGMRGAYYLARCPQLGGVALKADGRPLSRFAQEGVYSCAVPFLAVGKTGLVHLSREMTPVYGVFVDQSGKPARTGDDASRYGMYYTLGKSPAFCFTPALPSGASVTSFTVASPYSETARMLLYNHDTGEWDELGKSPVEVHGANALRYLGEKNEIYVQFVAATGNTSYYEEITLPYLELDGRLD